MFIDKKDLPQDASLRKMEFSDLLKNRKEKLKISNSYFLGRTIFSFWKVVSCAAFTPNGDLLTGDSNGTIIGWTKDSNQSSFCITNVHKG